MKKIRLVLSLAFMTSLLGGCSSFNGEAPAIKNGDLIYPLSDDPYRLRDVSFETLDNVIESSGDYIVLFSQKGCSSCVEFKPVIEQYIKETNQLVLHYEVSNSDFISEFLPKYKDTFFPNGEIFTPSLFVASKGNTPERMSNNMFKTALMLKNLMKDKVYETEVYSFTRFTPLKNFIEKTSEFDLYAYDQSDEDHVSAYNSFVRENILKSTRKSAILDLSYISENDKEAFTSLLNVSDFSKLTKFEIKDQNISSGQIIDSPVNELYQEL